MAVRTPSSSAASSRFLALYRAHFGYVWKTARRLGVSAAEVDDVVQETFLTVHRLLDGYAAQGSERSWLFAILFRVVQHHRRSRRRRISSIADESTNVEALPGPAGTAPDRHVQTSETIRVLEEILDGLDPEKRAVLVLSELEEKSVTEIAAILGQNVNTVASRLRTARAHVEAAMARHRARDGWRYK